MITYEAIKSLEGMNDKTFKELRELAKEAEDIEKLIKETWKFKRGETIIKVLESSKSDKIEEDLTIGGLWMRGKDNFYDICISCIAAEIFKYLLAEFMVNNKLPCVDGRTSEMAETCEHFKEFLRRTEQKHYMK